MQGNTSSEQVSPKQQKLIAALLAGQTIQNAASTAGCNEATAHAWLKLEHVRQAYNNAKRALFDEALSGLMLDVSEARATLRDIMKDAGAPHSSRVRAAQILLEQAIESHKMSELEAKIAELEDLVKK